MSEPTDRDTASGQQIARMYARIGSAGYVQLSDAIAQALAEVRAEESATAKRLSDAIAWALGENGEFLTQTKPRFWWRTELRVRAFGPAPGAPESGSIPSRPCLCGGGACLVQHHGTELRAGFACVYQAGLNALKSARVPLPGAGATTICVMCHTPKVIQTGTVCAQCITREDIDGTILNQRALPSPPDGWQPEKVTRFEVIDHRAKVGLGRVYTAHGCRIELSYQDDGRTLKVFVNLPPPPQPPRDEP